MNKSVFVLFAVVVFTSVNGELSVDQLTEAVNRACPQDHGCPQGEYGVFEEAGWTWNYTAIRTSSQSAQLMKMPLTRDLVVLIKAIYCCTNGRCLETCTKRNMKEIQLIQNFPSNGKELLSLNFKPLKQHHQNVEKWLENFELGKERNDKYPDEIENFLDDVHRHQHAITQLLDAQKDQKTSSGLHF